MEIEELRALAIKVRTERISANTQKLCDEVIAFSGRQVRAPLIPVREVTTEKVIVGIPAKGGECVVCKVRREADRVRARRGMQRLRERRRKAEGR